MQASTEPTNAPLLSIVVPMHNEEDTIPLFLPKVQQCVEGLGEYEIVCVDDGSRDRTFELLKEAHAADPRVRYVSFSRNFGHQAALNAGICHARGQAVVTMDADLQHPPEFIPTMLQHWNHGQIKVVQMIRQSGGETAFKKFTSQMFYRGINWIGHCQITNGAADFRLLDRVVVDVIKSLPERDQFLRGTIPWLGYTQMNLPYTPSLRVAGTTKYSLSKMMNLAISGVTSVSVRPLRLSSMLGIIMAALASVYALYALIAYCFFTSVPGWASILAGMMMIGGVQLLMLGLIGEYIGKILVEVKGRPPFIVRERV